MEVQTNLRAFITFVLRISAFTQLAEKRRATPFPAEHRMRSAGKGICTEAGAERARNRQRACSEQATDKSLAHGRETRHECPAFTLLAETCRSAPQRPRIGCLVSSDAIYRVFTGGCWTFADIHIEHYLAFLFNNLEYCDEKSDSKHHYCKSQQQCRAH